MAIDEYGLGLNGYHPGGKCGPSCAPFVDELLATLVFHVTEAGGEAFVTAGLFGPNDGAYDLYNQPVPGLEQVSVTIRTPDPQLPTLSPWSQLVLVAVLIGAGLGAWRRQAA
jgi:hypothetical protein